MSKYVRCIAKLNGRALRDEISTTRNLVELGERRIMALAGMVAPDGREIAGNRVAIEFLLAHLRILEAKGRGEPERGSRD